MISSLPADTEQPSCDLAHLTSEAATLRDRAMRRGGRVTACAGVRLDCKGLPRSLGVGDLCRVARQDDLQGLPAEVIAIDETAAQLLAYGDIRGVQIGCKVWPDRDLAVVRPDRSWLGRVIGPLGDAVDEGPPIGRGARAYPVQADPLAATERAALGPRMTLGVRVLDLFTPCRIGQRLGLFAGSGVGKSSLLSIIAKASDADVLVIGLIGERGRELNEFLHDTLGEAGRRRSVVVAATSDMPAMTRRRAAYVALAIAEYFRDQGLNCLCLLDSVTRFAMALREIYLAAGEPPTNKGYPPSVFAELPRLLERAGPGRPQGGSITGLFTVLVEGDDTNEPVADTVRGILDGHVIMDRRIAESGRYPAVDILRSVSRTTPGCYSESERAVIAEARRLLGAHADMAEMIQLGAYTTGHDPVLDRAIALRPAIEALCRQDLDEAAGGGSAFDDLASILAR